MSKIARSGALCGAFLAVAAVSSGVAAKKPSFGDGSVLATIPAQAAYCAGEAGCNGGFPEGIVVVGNRVFVTGPATFGTVGKGPSVVTVLDRNNGDLLTEIPIVGENTAFEHALSGIAADGRGNVYVLSTQLGVIRIEHHGNQYTQEPYAPPLPDLPVCAPQSATPCSPTFIDLPPLSNEMIFDDDGNLYLTDSLQATIFRVPPEGGATDVWFQSPLLGGSLAAPLPFGANGIKISPDRDWVYVVDTFDPFDPSLGRVYRVPLVEAPDASEIELFHTFSGFVAPDSLVFGRSGTLYVSLAGSNQIAVIDEDGVETTRLSGPAGSPIPLDGPSMMAFDDSTKSLLVANHAIFGDPSHYAVLSIYVGEKGDVEPDPKFCH